MSDEYQYEWAAWKFDWNACALWPGYSTSSNRLEYINVHFAEGVTPAVSNEFDKVRNELLALPAGTMQMLPTNQFYNVED